MLKTPFVNTDDEMSDLVNENDVIIGKISRKQAHTNKSLVHRAIAVLVFNSNNELLLQKRSLDKQIDPGCWTVSCSGHVSSGETYDKAALRELEEELGLNLKSVNFITKNKFEYQNETEFMSFFRIDTNDPIIPYKEEIEECKFFKLNDEFFNKTLTSLQITPDLHFIANFYLKKLI